MENNDLPRLLRKYLRGECTPGEQAKVDAWFLNLEQNPDDARLLQEAQEQMLGDTMFRRILARIGAGEEKPVATYTLRGFFKVAAAIAVIGLVGAGIILFSAEPNKALPNEVAEAGSGNITIANSSAVVNRHNLSDGSIIDLQPNGTITFPKTFGKTSRHIALTGEAFFDVFKEKDRPFIISTNDVTVKVLGTSFNVKSYEHAEEITVAVKTGRVSVSRPAGTDGSNEVILTPNQEVVYNTVKENFSKKIVAEPQIILAKPTLFEMKYDGTPVDLIFETMEENYGINIVFNREVLATCTLTTSMSEEGFYERIEIICQAIGAQYEIRDAAIVIKSTGCLENAKN